MNLVLFYVWEDARVWAHWNYFFDVHLYVQPVSCFLHPKPSGCITAAAEMAGGLMAATYFTYWYGRWYSLLTVYITHFSYVHLKRI